MDSATEKLKLHKESSTAVLIFNNPARRNAITADMWRAIPSIMKNLAEDPAIKCVILKGEGRVAFVAGADISQFESERQDNQTGARYDALTDAAFEAIADCPKPTVAAIHGYCIGAGMAIALCCDIRIAAEDAQFAIPAAKLGLSYPMAGLRRLLEAVGPASAKEILFTARSYSAEEALRIGIAGHVVAKDKLDLEATQLCERIAANAPLSLKAAKFTIGQLLHPKSMDMAAIEALSHACYESRDYREGRRAFLEKRAPRFEGR
jgi:enoyl-CoA hydratase/carnithine racemase